MALTKFRIHLELLNLPAKPDFHEIVLKCNGKKLFPLDAKYYKIQAETAIPINIEMEVDEHSRPVMVELWEYRFFLPDDYIGLFKLEPLHKESKVVSELANNAFSVMISLEWSAKQLINLAHRESAKQLA